MMISIAMATYNGEKFIKEQIESIINQTFNDWELIITDDCSSDKTLDILKKYQELDSRIHVFSNEHNLGYKDNFAKAISYCSGDFIACSDQDDVWTKDHLELLINNIGNYSLICSNSTLVDEKLNELGYDLHNDRLLISEDKNLQFIQLIYANFVQGCTVLFRKELLQKYLPIPTGQKYHDYWLAWVAVTNNGIKYINKSTLLYRQHECNYTDNSRTSITKRIANIFKYRNEFCNNINWANDVFNLDLSEKQREELIKGIEFLNTFNNPTKRISFIPYYIKNYKLIHSVKNYKDFTFRFIKRFIFLR